MRELSLSGLPARYALKPGDLMSFIYGAPLRYGLHEVVGEVTAGLDGVTGMVEVNPPLRPALSQELLCNCSTHAARPDWCRVDQIPGAGGG